MLGRAIVIYSPQLILVDFSKKETDSFLFKQDRVLVRIYHQSQLGSC